jgi:cellulose synthase/poly-beta-1,6-N-acetylglucosamine synthase-like glycosyltransferase
MDMWVIGIFVVVLHDLSDAFLASCRMHREYKKPIQFLLNINYVLMVLSWIGLRVIAFGYSCVWAVWYQYFEAVKTVS